MSFLDKGQNIPQLKFFPTFSPRSFSVLLPRVSFFSSSFFSIVFETFPISWYSSGRPSASLFIFVSNSKKERGSPLSSEEDTTLFSYRFASRTEFIYFNKPFSAFFHFLPLTEELACIFLFFSFVIFAFVRGRGGMRIF